jgi:hypothetical protein
VIQISNRFQSGMFPHPPIQQSPIQDLKLHIKLRVQGLEDAPIHGYLGWRLEQAAFHPRRNDPQPVRGVFKRQMNRHVIDSNFLNF